jgi:hypothetical protein
MPPSSHANSQFQRYPQTLSQKHAREMIKYATKVRSSLTYLTSDTC